MYFYLISWLFDVHDLGSLHGITHIFLSALGSIGLVHCSTYTCLAIVAPALPAFSILPSFTWFLAILEVIAKVPWGSVAKFRKHCPIMCTTFFLYMVSRSLLLSEPGILSHVYFYVLSFVDPLLFNMDVYSRKRLFPV